MREMAAMRKIKSQDRIAWLKYAKHYCSICLCTGMRLNIYPFGIE